jgi:hypothetical protein
MCGNLHNLRTEACSEIVFEHRSYVARPKSGATGELSPRGDQVDMI